MTTTLPVLEDRGAVDRVTKGHRPRGVWTFILVLGASVIVGISIPTAVATLSGGYGSATVLVAGIGIAALLALTIRWPFLPLVLYWGLYSLFSVFQLSTWRVVLIGLPITVPDGIVLLMLVAVGIRWIQRSRFGVVAPQSRLAIGMILLLGYGLLSAGLGAVHGFSGYAIGIDLRALAYVVIGFAAARLTLPVAKYERALVVLFLVGLAGLVVEQTAVTLQQFARLPGLSVSIAALRDIGAPYYLGKYGVFLLLLMSLGSVRERVALVATTLAGLAAMAATFIRTAWLEAAVGIVVVVMLGGWRAARRTLVVAAFGLIAVTVSLGLIPQVGVLTLAAQGRLDQLSLGTLDNVDTVASRFVESRVALANLRAPQDWVFGVGLGLSVADSLHPNQHNSFVWALSKQGILGLLLFSGVIVIMPLVIGLRAMKHTMGVRWALLIALLAAHIANAVGGYASGNLTFSAYTPLLGMSLAWIAEIAARSMRDHQMARTTLGPPRTPESIAAAAGGW
jgi:hypothetical protein